MDLAEVDSGDDSKDSYLDSESTDNGSELTEVTMSNTSSSTRSGRRAGPTAQEEHFFSLNQCMFLTKQFFLNRILHRVNYLTFIYKRWERGSHPGGGGYSHTLPIRVCATRRGRDFEAPDLERGIHFTGIF